MSPSLEATLAGGAPNACNLCHLDQTLDDPYGVVRYVAARSLRTLPGFQDFEYDFLAAESELAERSQAAIRQWKTGRDDGSVHGRILINAEGEVKEAAVAGLLRRRDHRSVTVQE